jgi:hypothetical protein
MVLTHVRDGEAMGYRVKLGFSDESSARRIPGDPVPVSGASVDVSVGVEIADRFLFTIGVDVDAQAAPGLVRKLFKPGDSTEVDYRIHRTTCRTIPDIPWRLWTGTCGR